LAGQRLDDPTASVRINRLQANFYAMPWGRRAAQRTVAERADCPIVRTGRRPDRKGKRRERLSRGFSLAPHSMTVPKSDQWSCNRRPTPQFQEISATSLGPKLHKRLHESNRTLVLTDARVAM
jgi:hypothetical protein